MHSPQIITSNLCKSYRESNSLSLDRVTLSVFNGEKFGVFGPNGAGKTTFISILCGLLKQTSGSVEYYRDSLKLDQSNIKSIIGFVPQEYSLYDDLSATQNLEYFGALYNLSAQEIKQQTKHLLSNLGLLAVANKKVRHFSGGMKRRLNLAIGIIHSPEIIFLDEPTVGVDIQSKNAIIKFLNELNQKGATIVYTSHHLSEAEEFCDRIAVLDHGKLVVCDELSALLQKYDAPDLQSVILELTGEEYRDNV